MQAWPDLNTIGAVSSTCRAYSSSFNGSSSSSSSSSNRNSGKIKKRRRDSEGASPITVVITDAYSFRAKVHRFTGMPTPPAASSTAEEISERPPLPFKPRAQRGVINIPALTTNSTYCSNLLCKLPGDPPVEALHASNSMLQLPDFSENKASNHKCSNSVSLLFEEFLEELERTENAAK